MRLNCKQIKEFTGGTYLIEPIDASRIVYDMTWDSRDVKDGDLFVALPGENVDGHNFVGAALHAGAKCILVMESPNSETCLLAQELGVGIIQVPNTYHAVEDLALHWRDFLHGKVIAVTGSVGKTTTKNFVRDVVSSKFTTVATRGNQNNELGVPKTILNADPDTQVIVVEMGMRGSGQIAKLCTIARPDIGLISNIGECHMELLGSKEAIARAKGELLCALPDGYGKAILNAQDEYSEQLFNWENLKQRGIDVAWFGSAQNTSAKEESWGKCWFEDLTLDSEGRPSFTLCAQGFALKPACDEPQTLFDIAPDVMKRPLTLAMRGTHNAINACSAACAGLIVGVGFDEIIESLKNSVPETGRLEIIESRQGFKVINDAYNANPDSMRAALSMLSVFETKGRKIAVLGDMGELGEVEVECHKGIGQAASSSNLDLLICVGELSQNIAQAAVEGGMVADNVKHVDNIASALALLEGKLSQDDVVLVKASHFMRLDHIVEGLTN